LINRWLDRTFWVQMCVQLYFLSTCTDAEWIGAPSDCHFRRFNPVFYMYGLRSPQPPDPHAINRWRDGWCRCVCPFQWFMGSSIVDDCTDTRIRFQPKRKTPGFRFDFIRFFCDFPTCNSLDLCPHSRILGIVGIWYSGWCRCETVDRCDTRLWESNCSDPYCSFRGNPGRNCKPTKEERDSFCCIDILWNLVVCCLFIFLKRKEVIGIAFPKGLPGNRVD